MAAEPTFKNLKRGNEQGKNPETTLQFRMSPTLVSYANTLRRLCVAHVPMVAFRADILEEDVVDATGRIVQAKGSTSDVQVLENTTPMTNEMLAHRIGLLPLAADPMLWEKQNGQSAVFELNISNANDQVLDVTTNDFVLVTKGAEGQEKRESAAEMFAKADPAYACLIATLKPYVKSIQVNQEKIHVRARATVGVGRENARFIPVSRATYSYTRIDPDASNLKESAELQAAYADWVGKKGVNLESLKSATDEDSKKQEAALWSEFITTPIQRYYLKDEATGEPNSFDFVLESVMSALKPEVIVQRALKAGADLCERYMSGGPGWAGVKVQFADTRFYAFDLYFQKEDHTLGNLVQTFIEQNLMDMEEKGITFVGYDIPHPLRDEMVIRLGLVNDTPQEAAVGILEEAMAACKQMFEALLAEWNSASGLERSVASPAPVASQTTGIKPKRAIKRPQPTA
jgi:DNA-directed RNA polymerase I and III subunit RPAC1